MANTILTPTMVARESSLILANALGFAGSVSRRYDDRFARGGAKIGSRFDIRIPPRYTVTKATAMPSTVQDSEESSRSLKIDYAHVPLIFTDKELLLDINSFGDQFLRSAVAALANEIDLDGTLLYRDIANIVGTIGGGSPTKLTTYLAANAILTEEGVPIDGRRVVCINAAQNEKIIDALKGLYHDDKEISDQFTMAKMRKAAGLNWLADQNMYLHTNGDRAAAGALNGAPSSGDATLAVDGLGATKTIKRGDTFTIADVYAVNPQSRQSTGRLRNFVVTKDKTSDASGEVTLDIFPSLVSSGKDQTVNSLPADDAVVTFNADASKEGHQAMAYHPEAFALAMVDDNLPDGVDFKAKTSPIDAQAWNVSVSVIRDYDISNHNYPCRIGAYYGWLAGRPEMACRVTS